MANKNTLSSAAQTRVDWYDDAIDYATRPAEKTPEGFLVARAPVTSIGVFTYRNPDGSPRRELRLPEEVFAEASLESLKMKPLTLLHPDGAVTPENIGQLQVGSVGSDVTTDSYRVYVSLSATKQDGIDAVENGSARSLSCGYNCDIEWTSGTWMGMDYDCIQRNIRYNHVALVPVPRAGDGNAIRMDSAGIPGLPDLNKHETKTREEDMSLKTIHLDGADYQAEPQVIAAYDKASARADSLEKELNQAREDGKKALDEALAGKSSAEAERDSYRERLDALKKDMPNKVAAAVKSRITLCGQAQKAGVEVRDDMSDMDIKKAVILKKFPTANLDGKDDSYILSRFDCACELIAADAEAQSRKDAAETTPHNVNPTAQDKLEASRKAYNARMDSAWQDNPKK